MTQTDMYKELIRRNRYGYDGCYPSNRYESCHDVDYSWWKSADEITRERIRKCMEKKKENRMDYNNTKIFVDGQTYNAHDIEITETWGEFPKITATAYLSPSNMVNTPRKNCAANPSKPLTIKKVHFNPPVTVVLWNDKTKTIVRCNDKFDTYDPEKGLAMAIAKKLMGDNKGKYYDLFKYWRNKWDEQNKPEDDAENDEDILNVFNDIDKNALTLDDLTSSKENH